MTVYRVPELDLFQWQQPVTDQVTAPTGSEVKGTRYIVIVTATGVFTGHEKSIATAKITNPILEADWYFDVPSEGCICWVDDENVYYVYNGSTWSGYFNQPVLTTSSPYFAGLQVKEHLKFDDDYYNLFVGKYTGYFNDPSGGVPNGRNNTYFGCNCGVGISPNTGYCNTGVGSYVLYKIKNGYYNVGMGDHALTNLTSGIGNFGLGNYSLASITTESYNVGLGYSSLRNCISSCNTGIGSNAGGNLTTGNYGVFIGNFAGFRQTINSNLLIIDNQDRTSAALEFTNSLIYGVFDISPANQTLRINATLISQNLNPNTDNTYYLGKNSISTPLAYKGVILKDTTNGNYYRIEVINSVVTATQIT